jgi:hypothetical protein
MTIFANELQLADALENPASHPTLDLVHVAGVVRMLSERLQQTLKAANDLAASMDSVYTDRVALAAKVEELTAERHLYQASGSNASMGCRPLVE